MKILSVAFANLNSLRDPVTLDFATGPLALAGLFAITGPTGAGKSTILDAITLGLYNATARNQRGEIVSRGRRDAYAEVEFEVHGQVYRSRWDIHLPKSRKRVSQERRPGRGRVSMSLAKLNGPGDPEGKIIADFIKAGHERSVPDAVAAITSLDFTRFRQSMLLAQGEFDAFLTAEQGRRSDLLEQITGTEVYSQVSQAVFLRHKSREQAVLARQKALDARGLPDPEEVQRRRHRVRDLEITAAAASESLTELRAQRTAHARQAELATSQRRLTFDREAYAAAAPERERVKRSLARHRRAEQVGEQLRVEAKTRADLEGTKVELARAERAQLLLIERAPALLQELTAAKADRFERRAAKENATRHSVELQHIATLQQRAEAQREQLILEEERLSRQLAQLEIDAKAAEKKTGGLRAERADLQSLLAETASYSGLKGVLESIRGAQDAWLESARELRLAGEAQQAAEQRLSIAQQQLTQLEEVKPRPPESELIPPDNASDVVAARQLALEAEREAIGARLEELVQFGSRLGNYVEAREKFDRRRAEAAEYAKQLVRDREATEAARLAEQNASAALARAQGDESTATEALAAVKQQLDLRTQHAHLLEDGAPCPLCGALEHPASADHQADARVVTAASLLPHEKRVAETREGRIAAEKLATEASETLQACRLQLAAAEARADTADVVDEEARLTDLAEGLLANYPVDAFEAESPQLTKAALASLRRRYGADKTRAASLTTLIKQYTAYAQQQAAYMEKHAAADRERRVSEQERQTTAKRYAEALMQEGEAAHSIRALAEHNHLPTENLPRAGYITELRDQIDLARQRRVAYNEAGAKLESLVAATEVSNNRAAELRTQLAAFAGKREATDSELIDLVQRSADLLGDATTADELLAIAESAVNAANAAVETAEANVAQSSRAQAAAQERLDSLTERLTLLTQASRTLAAEVSVALAEAEFPNREAAREALLEQGTLERLILGERDAAAEETRITTLAAKLEQEQQQLAGALAGAPAPADVTAALASAEAANEARQRELGSLRSWLERAAEDTAEHAAEAARILARREALADWTTLNKLVGSADGKKFRQFAQRLTLQRLLGHANRHLAAFYPRFSVGTDPDPGSDSLAVYVCDRYEADQVRDVATVSGGERFLVSLALALGFSHMASRRLSIDTLFIDEGFGALDGETLDRAIDALERLRAGGKTIGIISHVAALQERIATQVRVERGGASGSRIVVDA